MKRKHEIPAFYHTETEEMLEVLQKMGVDTSHCYICKRQIIKTERPPQYLSERWKTWRYKQKFYDWNISGISKQGVICDKLSCLWEANHKMAKSTTEGDKT